MRTRHVCLLGVLSLTSALPAFATNGYFAHGYGTWSQAMGGTGVAMSLDAMAPATNPAGIAFMDNRTDLGVAAFDPRRGYETRGTPSGACGPSGCTFGVGPQSMDSEEKEFAIPQFGLVRKINDASAWGLAIYGNGGMNTRYRGGSATFGTPGGAVTAPGTYGGGTAGVDLIQLFVAPTYAHRLGQGASWGVTPIFAFQRFEARGLGNFAPFSSDPSHLTDNGHDNSYGGGMRVGVQATIVDGYRVGASYQSRIYMSRFKDYSGLFAEHGDFDIPSSAAVGLAVTPYPEVTLAMDVQYIRYSEVKSVGNPMLPNLATSSLGSDNGAGFGWKDMTVYKVGGRWQLSDTWTMMAGYSYGRQPVPKSEMLFNILAPGVVEQHITWGFARRICNHEFSTSVMYAPPKSISGPNPLDPSQTIELHMHQWQVAINFSF